MKAIVNVSTRRRAGSIMTITNSMLRHFVPIANKSLLNYPLESIAQAGVREVAIIYNEGVEEVVKNSLGDGSRYNLKLTYILQPNQFGNVDAILLARDFLGEDKFLFYLGDNFLAGGIKEAVTLFSKSDLNAMVLRVLGHDNKMGGVPLTNSESLLVDYLEKPKHPPNKYAVPGLYFFDSSVFVAFDRIIALSNREYKMFQVMQWLIAQNKKVGVFDYSDPWFDFGKYDNWIAANQYLLDRDVTLSVKSQLGKNVVVSGRVSIGKNCKLSDSELRGPCKIGDDVTIAGSFIGSFSAIGNNCQIVNSNVENSILMPGVSISEVSPLIDRSIFGPNSRVVSRNGSMPTSSFFVGSYSKIVL